MSSTHQHVTVALSSLQAILDDDSIPASVKERLKDDYQRAESYLEKLAQGQVHIAVFGRVSVGKSSLLNALLGRDEFPVHVLHGETKEAQFESWESHSSEGLYLIDTPGINEIDGEAREELSRRVAAMADIILFVVDGDLTEVEWQALQAVHRPERPLIVAINKADRYTHAQKDALHQAICKRLDGLVPADRIVFSQAQASSQLIIQTQEDGSELESERTVPADVEALKSAIAKIVETDGPTLAALNAALFAGELTDQLSARVIAVKSELGKSIIQSYCLAKGVAVALNPVPIADLLAAVAVDVAMIIHLARIYGLPITKKEAQQLILTITGQLVLLMGATWGIHLLSSAFKFTTFGLSTALTGVTQGAIAWYSTLVVGRVAEQWLGNGKSWGEAGPKLAVRTIIDSLDRESIMQEAKQEILQRLKTSKEAT